MPGGVAALAASASDTAYAAFGICKSGGGTNCVVDGDTIWYRGSKIRIADIDTPETHRPRCAAEAARGAALAALGAALFAASLLLALRPGRTA